MAKQRETQFKERVQRDLKQVPNTWFYKTQDLSRRGIPDFILCVNGWFFALELKVSGGVVAPLQEYKVEKIKEACGSAYIVTPDSWPQVLETIKHHATRKDDAYD